MTHDEDGYLKFWRIFQQPKKKFSSFLFYAQKY